MTVIKCEYKNKTKDVGGNGTLGRDVEMNLHLTLKIRSIPRLSPKELGRVSKHP